MADTITLNYDFVKPEPGASEDTWGDKLNANWDSVDAVIKALDTRVVTNKNKGDTNATNIAANLVKINTNISQINAVKARATAATSAPVSSCMRKANTEPMRFTRLLVIMVAMMARASGCSRR